MSAGPADGSRRLTRLFVAVTLPARVRERLEALDRPEVDGVRWTAPAQWHVTLRFLGDLDLRAAVRALDRMEAPAAEAELGPVVGWLGRRVVQVPVGGLDEIADAVDGVMDAVAAPRDHPFVGHVTLGRAKRRRPPLDLVGTPVSCRFRAEGVALMGSRARAGPGPVRYETVAVRALEA